MQRIKLIESEKRAYRVLDNGHELAISIAEALRLLATGQGVQA